MKGGGEDEQKKGRKKTTQVLGNYFRLPYLLNLNNSFLSQRGGKHVLFTQWSNGSSHNNAQHSVKQQQNEMPGFPPLSWRTQHLIKHDFKMQGGKND